MRTLMVDFITSLDGYAAADGWPGYWGMEGPEYLGWLGQQPDHTALMGAKTYRLMSGFATESQEDDGFAQLAQMSKVVFSSTLQAPLSWPNTRLIGGDAVEAVSAMKGDGTTPLHTLGSLSLCRALITAGLVDRFRVVVLPGHHRRHRPGADLRRLPRRRSRPGRESDLRRKTAAAGVRAHRAQRAARQHGEG